MLHPSVALDGKQTLFTRQIGKTLLPAFESTVVTVHTSSNGNLENIKQPQLRNHWGVTVGYLFLC